MRKVFVTRRLPPIAKEILAEKFEVHSNEKNEPFPRDKLYNIVADYNAILSTVTEKFDMDILRAKDKLEIISNYAVGLDNIDLEYARSIGITVCNTPDVVTNSTADLTFSILLALVRKIPSAQKFVRQNKWSAWDPEMFLGEELSGKNFGVWGFGRVGQAVAKRAYGFGLNIIYYNHSTVSSVQNPHFKPVELNELLETSDYLSIHLPLSKETNGLVDKKIIAKMKKRPIILNMARGDIIVTNDIVEALKKGKIRGAALDVTSPEPLSGNHELCELKNCVVVPHIGTATHECRLEMARLAAKNIVNHFS